MFPIFFSVSSNDATFAEEIWHKLPADWAYIYTKNGEEGVHMWDEISRRELPRSKLLVVYWSKNYAKAEGCIREILQAKDLVRQSQLRPVVLRLDDFPITWSEELGEGLQPVFDALKVMLDYRTSSPNIDVQQAFNLVQRAAEPFLKSDHPVLPRHELLQTLRKVVQKGRFNCYPAVWVSGYNGIGRETLIRNFHRSFAPNGRGIVVEVNESSLPKQVLLRIESEAFDSEREHLLELNAEAANDSPQAVVDAIERVFAAGNYLILRHSRVVEENVDLPEWIDEAVNSLSASNRPKLYILSQLPLFGARHNRTREALVAQRVPSVDDHQLAAFCDQLIGHYDNNPERWPDEEIEKVVRSAGGNIGFLVSLVRACSGVEDFDQIDQLIETDSRSFAAAITVYVRWAFSQLRDFDDEQRVLLFLNDVSPCDVVDLEKVVAPKKSILRVLGKLLDLGMVEREGDNLYRLTPMLAHRLSRDLLRPELLVWLREALVDFLKNPVDFEADNHDFLRIESRIQAAMISDSEELPADVVGFVSAAHWLQAGIRLYHAKRREPAYKILKKAFNKRNQFTNASQNELIRYFCLSATRNRKYDEAQVGIALLERTYNTKGLAAFLRADVLEHQRRFPEAIKEYLKAIELNKGNKSRLERTYRPLVKCILYSHRPDFGLARFYALQGVQLKRTVYSLMTLSRVLLNWKFRGEKCGRDVPNDIEDQYQDSLTDLETHPGVGSAHFEIKSEEAELSGDFDAAVEYMDRAVAADPRFELRTVRWRLMAKSGVQKFATQVLEELDAAKNDTTFRSNWQPFLPALTETYATALKAVARPLGALNAFAPELSSDEIGSIVSRLNRARH